MIRRRVAAIASASVLLVASLAVFGSSSGVALATASGTPGTVVAISGGDSATTMVHVGATNPTPVASGPSIGPTSDPNGTGRTVYAPTALGVDGGTAAAPTRTLVVPYGTNYDFAPYSLAQKLSTDGGHTFSPGTYQNSVIEVQSSDGRTLGFDTNFDQSTNSNTSYTRSINRSESFDGGKTFTAIQTPGRIDISSGARAFDGSTSCSPFQRRCTFYPIEAVQVPGGPILMSGYGKVDYTTGATPVAAEESILLQSTDDGADWTFRSIIADRDMVPSGANYSGYTVYTEAGIAETSDGGLLAAIRSSSVTPNAYNTVTLRKSYDNGLTWTTPTPTKFPTLPGTSTSPSKTFDARVFPIVRLLPNGMLAVRSGRPDDWLAISADGTGNDSSWDWYGMYYQNHSQADSTQDERDADLNPGSSGNGGMDWVSRNQVLLTADTCHMVWDNPKDDTKYNTTNQYEDINECTNTVVPPYASNGRTMTDTSVPTIQSTLGDVLTPDTGRIDLAGKVGAGTASVTTTLNSTYSAHPRTGPLGPLNGSTEPWSDAIAAGSSQGTYDVTLDHVYTLDRVGLAEALGTTESATVQTKVDASDSWQNWFSTGTTNDFATRYYTPSARQARYVRVVTGAAGSCPPGVTAPCTELNQLELYSTVDSFENDPQYGVPRGWVAKETLEANGGGEIGSWVTSSVNGGETAHALLLKDSYSDHQPTVFEPASAASTRIVSFRADFTGGPGSLLFGVRNTQNNSTFTNALAYGFAVSSSGAVSYYNGSAYQQIAAGGTVNTNQWNAVTITANTATATIAVNGVTLGTATRWDHGSGPLAGPQFATSGTTSTGDNYLIDDVGLS